MSQLPIASDVPRGSVPPGAGLPVRIGGRLGNLAALAFSEGVRYGTGLGISLVLARSLGAAEFGVYGFVATLTAVAAFGSNLNLPLLLSREVARRPEQAARLAGEGLALTALASTITGLALVGYAAVQDGRGAVVGAAALAAVALGLNSAVSVLQAGFLGLGRTRLELRAVLGGRGVYVAATLALLGLGVAGAFLAQVLAATATLLVLGRAFAAECGPLALRTRWRALRELLRAALPFGLYAFLDAVYLQADVLLLQALHTDREVGLYQAAVLLILYLPVLAHTFNKGLYPQLVRCAGDPEAAGKLVSFSGRMVLVAGVPLAAGGLCLAGPLLGLLFGAGYEDALPALVIMLPLIPLRFLTNTAGTALSALNRQTDRTRGVACAAAFNLLGNLAVIPRYGAAGAALTTLLTEVLLLAVYALWLAPHVRGVRLGGAAARIGAAAAAMAAVVLALPGWPVIARIAVGASVYGAASWGLGAWSREDLGRLRRA